MKHKQTKQVRVGTIFEGRSEAETYIFLITYNVKYRYLFRLNCSSILLQGVIVGRKSKVKYIANKIKIIRSTHKLPFYWAKGSNVQLWCVVTPYTVSIMPMEFLADLYKNTKRLEAMLEKYKFIIKIKNCSSKTQHCCVTIEREYMHEFLIY